MSDQSLGGWRHLVDKQSSPAFRLELDTEAMQAAH